MMTAEQLFEHMEHECWDLRTLPPKSDETGCYGDVVWVVVEHYMAKPNERIVAYGNSPRRALEEAISNPMSLEAGKCQTI